VARINVIIEMTRILTVLFMVILFRKTLYNSALNLVLKLKHNLIF